MSAYFVKVRAWIRVIYAVNPGVVLVVLSLQGFEQFRALKGRNDGLPQSE
jgi:hypothetical protein